MTLAYRHSEPHNGAGSRRLAESNRCKASEQLVHVNDPQQPSRTRAEKVAAIEEACRLWPDLTHRERARRLGMSFGAYSNLRNDPDGSKQAARRIRYRGRCERCGGPTDGSMGPSQPSRRCKRCAAAVQREAKVWTRDAVIEAIRRWAEVYGRPPAAHEWIRAGTNPRHPALGSVYVSSRSLSSPFASWADAIEAAGFPRPARGRWRDESIRAATIRAGLLANPEWRLGRVGRQVLGHLRERDVTTRQELLGLLESPSSLTSAVRHLIDRGLVERVGTGRYRATVLQREAT